MSGQSDNPPSLARPTSPVPGWAIPLLFLVAICEGYDLQSAGIAAPLLAAEFTMSEEALGWFFGAGTIGLMFGAMAGGWISDRIGRKPALIISVFCFAAFSLLTAFATSADQFLLLRFLTGIGMGGTLPNIIALASEYAPPHRRSRAVGIVYAGMPVGAALVSLLGAAGGQDADWRPIFLVGGIVPLSLAAGLIFLLPASGRPAREKNTTVSPISSTQGLAALFLDGRGVNTLLLWAGSALLLLSTYILINWLPSLLVGKGFGREVAFSVQITFNLAGVAGSLAAGTILDRQRFRSTGVALLFAAYVLSIFTLANAPNDALIFIALGGMMGATATAVAAVLYALAPLAYPEAVRGTGVGMSVGMGRLGSTAGPVLAGMLLSGGLTPDDVINAMIPVILIGAICAIALSVRLNRKS